MAVKNYPSTLFHLSLVRVTKLLLQQWSDTYYTNYIGYSEELKNKVGVIIPFTVYDQIFDLMIDFHARIIQNERNSRPNAPCIPALIDSIIVPNLRKLNLNCLRHMGTVVDEEITYLESLLTKQLPNLTNLVEICLQTSGTDFTLPICTDEIMKSIGSSCSNLKTLDVSYNHNVTDKGLKCLVPTETHQGCPLLVKVSLFECSITSEGVAVILKGLLHLKFLGYRETAQSLLYLNKQILSSRPHSLLKQLELVHINNLGTISRTCKDLHNLKCDHTMVTIMCNLCPKLNGLKVRVDDNQVKFLQELSSVSILELVYNLGSPSSPGSNTIQYLQLCGAQFISLSFMCDTFTMQHLQVVCEQCNNLKRLWIRCNQFRCDKDITKSDRKKCVLDNLEVFFIRIGSVGFEHCLIPHSVFSYILHKSSFLTEIVLSMKNILISDSYVKELFSSLQTLRLKHVMIFVPYKNVTVSSVNLSMASVESLMGMCPNLLQLGNLLVWDVSLEEIQELKRQLKLSNSALVLVYKMVFS